eukprot:GHVS01000590.1.p1 GENE.GHVS01000590.1~~GHVS01000590.1.p1  ORF type:complete len:1335 (-),score=190.73 GHVS01000590.1:168-4172(-)
MAVRASLLHVLLRVCTCLLILESLLVLTADPPNRRSVWLDASEVIVKVKLLKNGPQGNTHAGSFNSGGVWTDTNAGIVEIVTDDSVVEWALRVNADFPVRVHLRALVDLNSIVEGTIPNVATESRKLLPAVEQRPATEAAVDKKEIHPPSGTPEAQQGPSQVHVAGSRSKTKRCLNAILRSSSALQNLKHKRVPRTLLSLTEQPSLPADRDFLETRRITVISPDSITGSSTDTSTTFQPPPTPMGPNVTDVASSNPRVLYPVEGTTSPRRSYMDLFMSGIDTSIASSMLTKVRGQVNQAMTASHSVDEDNGRSPISNLSLRPLKDEGSTSVDSPPLSSTKLASDPLEPRKEERKNGKAKKGGSKASIKVVDIRSLGSPIDENGNVVYYNNRVLVGWRCQRRGPESSQTSNKPYKVSANCYPSASHLVSYEPPSASLSFIKSAPPSSDEQRDRHLESLSSSFSSRPATPPNHPHRRRRLLQQKMSAYLADGSSDSIKQIYSKPKKRTVSNKPPEQGAPPPNVDPHFLSNPSVESTRNPPLASVPGLSRSSGSESLGGPERPDGRLDRISSGGGDRLPGVAGRLDSLTSGRNGNRGAGGLTRIVSMAVRSASIGELARKANSGGTAPRTASNYEEESPSTKKGKRRKPDVRPPRPIRNNSVGVTTTPSQPLDLMGAVNRLTNNLSSRASAKKSSTPTEDIRQQGKDDRPADQPSPSACQDQAAMDAPPSTVSSQLCGVDLIELKLPEPSGDGQSSAGWWGADEAAFFTELSNAFMQTKRNASFNDTSVLEAFLDEFSQTHYADDILFISPDAPIHVEHIKQHLLRTNKRATKGGQSGANSPTGIAGKQKEHKAAEVRRLQNTLTADAVKVSPNDPLFDLQWALHPARKEQTDRSYVDSVASAQPTSTASRGSNDPHAASAASAVMSPSSTADSPSASASGPLDIDILGAWDLLKPESPISSYAAATYPFQKSHSSVELSPVPVAIIDTGVNYLHPDLQNSMWINVAELHGKPGVDDDGNGFVDDVYGWNFFHGNNNPMDDNGHGSHVSGIVAATSNNQVGVSGIAPQARLMALKILDSRGEGDVSQAIPAIEYALSNNAKVITNSWGGIPSAGGARILEALLHEVVQDSADSTLIIAAGNDGVNITKTPYYPASFLTDNSITVGAYDSVGRVPSWANYGSRNVHLTAPGQNITSTWTGTGYRMSSGTSMAAPMVSGVAALVLSVNPYLMPQQVVDIIVQTVTPDAGHYPFSITGGRLNAWKAVALAPAYFLTLDQIFLLLGSEDGGEESRGEDNEWIGAAEDQEQSSGEVVLRFSTTALPVGQFSGKVELLWIEKR